MMATVLAKPVLKFAFKQGKKAYNKRQYQKQFDQQSQDHYVQHDHAFPTTLHPQPTAPPQAHTTDSYPYQHSYNQSTMLNLGSRLPTADSSSGTFGLYLRIFTRLLQFVIGLTVCGLYGRDLHAAQKAGVYADSKWVYAVTVGGLSALSVLIYMIPIFKSATLFAWDWTLWLLWLVLFGLFGKMYIAKNAEGDAGVQRMKNSVWVDLTGLLLWMSTAVYGTVAFWRARREVQLPYAKSEV
ncbi:hypothetical protein IWZ03DRAFT_205855 [Phyllosticta citriasiana]|uniref:MARVEL domain-containing protein n=2 Tax=Phyllosticta citriasiana TaxID=595635 RepID=A0ABR1KJ76_9PEZI